MASTSDDQFKGTGHPPPQPSYPMGYPPAYPSYPTTANGYPYAAPPPASYYNPYPAQAQPYDPRRASCIRRLLYAMIAAFAIMFLISFILWLVFHPQAPIVTVDSLSVSSFNISGSQLNANWDIGLRVRNPNKKLNTYYNQVNTFVLYEDHVLSSTELPPFYLGKMNQTTMRAKLVTSGDYIEDFYRNDMENARRMGVLSVDVRMRVLVRFQGGNWLTRSRSMRVFCENLKVGFTGATGAAVLMGGAKECLAYV